MSRTSDTAICATTSRPRSRPRSAPSRRPPVLSSVLTSARRAYSAGASPADRACGDRHQERHAEHAPVEAEIDAQRHLERQAGDAVLHGRRRRHRQQNGARAAEDRQHDALREELSNDPSAPGPERRAQRHLAPPRRGACQQHVRDVGARNAQQQSGQQREHGGGDVKHRAVLRNRSRVGLRNDQQRDALVRRRVLARRARRP